MKILGISGGNKNGANDCMCKEALLAAKEQGAEIEFVRLMEVTLLYTCNRWHHFCYHLKYLKSS